MSLALPPAAGQTRLVLVRHAEPDVSIRGRYCGHLDVELSLEGRRVTETLADALAAVGLAAVYSSPLRRALGTAEPIAARLGLRPVADDRIREIDFGELEGRRYDDVAAERPDFAREFATAPAATRFPGGESYGDLRTRVLAAAADIRAAHTGCSVAIVAHAGVTRTVLADALGLDATGFFRLAQPYGAVSVVDWSDGTPLVRGINVGVS